MKKFEICNVCDGCGNWFVCRHKDTKWCSAKCWKRSPKQVKWRKEHPHILSEKSKRSKLNYWRSPEGRRSWRKGMQLSELRRALKVFGCDKRGTGEELYRHLVRVVNSNKRTAQTSLKGRKPDAYESKVEFKSGIDHLRGAQLVWDILEGKKTKVRWFPSWDSLEQMLEKKESDKSVLFDSYLSFVLWATK